MMTAVLPPLVSLILAIATRNTLVSLASGCLLGGFLIAESFVGGLGWFISSNGFLSVLTHPSNYQIIFIMILIAGFVGLIEASGISLGFGAWIASKLKGPRESQLAAWFSGIVIFFTDSGNSLILGPVYRPIFDQMKISRQKLAYILDSTTSPICVLIPFISWGVYISSLIEQNHPAVGISITPLSAFMHTLPFQLYPMITLCLVPVVIIAGVRLGSMPVETQSEFRAVEKQKLDWLALFPIVFLLLCIASGFLLFLAIDGVLKGQAIRTSLMVSYGLASLVFGSILLKQGRLNVKKLFSSYWKGIKRVSPILLVVILAWTLSLICKQLGTGQVVSQIIGKQISIHHLAAIIFLLGAGTSFAIGSSWGTFAILMPIALPLGLSLGAHPWLVVGAVLSGGLFGDHCSPISDTTLLASMGADCEHQSHVRTQLPYALVAGGLALVGFIILGYRLN